MGSRKVDSWSDLVGHLAIEPHSLRNRNVIISVLLNVVHFVINLSLLPRATFRLLPAINLSVFKRQIATFNCFLLTSRVKLLKRT